MTGAWSVEAAGASPDMGIPRTRAMPMSNTDASTNFTDVNNQCRVSGGSKLAGLKVAHGGRHACTLGCGPVRRPPPAGLAQCSRRSSSRGSRHGDWPTCAVGVGRGACLGGQLLHGVGMEGSARLWCMHSGPCKCELQEQDANGNNRMQTGCLDVRASGRPSVHHCGHLAFETRQRCAQALRGVCESGFQRPHTGAQCFVLDTSKVNLDHA
eukprot:355077-Chlamydomonas_euryale.AAC.10